MIPVGYMYKTISSKPDWLETNQVSDIYSVSGCESEDFTDWINYWKHNGYWFFDSPKVIEDLVREQKLSLKGMTLFFYCLSMGGLKPPASAGCF
jgi:GH35 family endo-1,4-beta-xylanase